MQKLIMLWIIFVSLVMGLTSRNVNSRQVTEARTFCAYGRIFVEFEDNGRLWGTLMLDFRGQPIPCKDDADTTPITTTI